jgi:2-dehydro-3-deoxygalactonokinase
LNLLGRRNRHERHIMGCDTFLAIDWGTTNRRVYLIENGEVTSSAADGLGAMSGCNFADEVATLRAQYGDHPMLLAGMVGSTVGWRDAGYVTVPAGLRQLSTALLAIDERTAIVPGVCMITPPDVMRGEEVQLLGAVAAGYVPTTATLVQPGTHCKWVRVEGCEITSFNTAMTGELFALIRRHSLLAPQLLAEVSVCPAFLDGITEGSKGDLAASLFQIRAAAVLGQGESSQATSFASGLLVGSDVAARIQNHAGGDFHILADEALGSLYAAALDAFGRKSHFVDSHLAFVAGIKEIAGQWQL